MARAPLKSLTQPKIMNYNNILLVLLLASCTITAKTEKIENLSQIEQEEKKPSLDDLFYAVIKQGDIQAIQKFIYAQKNRQEFINKGLNLAARLNKIDLIHYFLQIGANIDSKDGCGWAPLHYAVNNDNLEAAQILLIAGAHKDILTWWCRVSPIFIAIERSNLDMVKLLVQARVRLDIKSYWLGHNVLHATIDANDDRILEYLIHVGAPLNTRDGLDRTPFMYASQRGCSRLMEVIAAAHPIITTKDILWIETTLKKQEDELLKK